MTTITFANATTRRTVNGQTVGAVRAAMRLPLGLPVKQTGENAPEVLEIWADGELVTDEVVLSDCHKLEFCAVPPKPRESDGLEVRKAAPFVVQPEPEAVPVVVEPQPDPNPEAPPPPPETQPEPAPTFDLSNLRIG